MLVPLGLFGIHRSAQPGNDKWQQMKERTSASLCPGLGREVSSGVPCPPQGRVAPLSADWGSGKGWSAWAGLGVEELKSPRTSLPED